MRLFIAIQLDERMKAALTEMQAYLRARRVGGNYTKPENLHITLAFIGEYSDPERVLEVMQRVPLRAFPLRLEGFGCFGDLYWCGISGQEALTACARQLRRALAEADIPFDRKRFTPHITLLRRARFTGLPRLEVPAAEMEVSAISLMRSDRGRDGMIYTELARVEGADAPTEL